MQKVTNTSGAQPFRVRLARGGLKIFFIPVIALTAISRMTPPRWFWVDIACVAGWGLLLVFAVIGHVFGKDENGTPNA